MSARSAIGTVIGQDEQALLAEWIERQLAGSSTRLDVLRESELRQQARDFLMALGRSVDSGTEEIEGAGKRSKWKFAKKESKSSDRLQH